MASYLPPTENLAIFDPSVFRQAGLDGLTYDEAVKYFLKYPNAQGTENLQAINVNGVATFNTDVIVNGNFTFNDAITIADGADTSTISMSATTDALTIKNDVVSGTMVFAVEDSAGTQKNIITGTANVVNLNGNQQVIMSGGTTTYTIQSTGTTTNSNLTINNANLVVSDTTSNATITIDQQPVDTYITNNMTSGTIFIQTKDGGGTTTDTLAISSGSNGIVVGAKLDMDGNLIDQIGSAVYIADGTTQTSAYTGAGALNGSYTNVSLTLDTDGKITAISNGGTSQTNTAEHYSTALNNVYPFGSSLSTIPLINFADVGTYASTYGMNYWDAVVFDIVFNLTISGVNTGSTDSGSVIINNNQVSGQLYVYPTAFTTTWGITPTPYFYLNGGIGSATNGASTYYNCPITAYTPNGRPCWTNNLLNQANINVCMPFHTLNNGTNAQMIFQFLPINWNSTTLCNWNLSLTLRNSGKIPASKITTQNFNINNI